MPAPKPRSTLLPERRSERSVLRRLRRGALPTDTIALARFLIGASLVSDSPEGRIAVRIVETEAYLPGDAAAHSYRGRTARNESLFLRAGHAYVYFIYGMYFCMNVSSETDGVGAGVLVRAGEPIAGIALMARRRPRASVADLCRGPGKLATALGITRAHDGLDLLRPGPLWLAASQGEVGEIAVSPRIGITKEIDRMLRFYVRDSPFRSATKKFTTVAP